MQRASCISLFRWHPNTTQFSLLPDGDPPDRLPLSGGYGFPMVNTPSQLPEESAAVFAILRHKAREIAAHQPEPDFYRDHADDLAHAHRCLDQAPLLRELRAFVMERLDDDFGHGIDHALKVAADAGALCLIEGARAGHGDAYTQRTSLICQAAGLLHDIRRKRPNHAVEGAHYARKALAAYAVDADEIDAICYAIRNHEAFQRIQAPPTALAGLMSDCLYDADKFRWGPDNFTDTLWPMIFFQNPPFEDFVASFPKGLQNLSRIRETFRTATGRRYGPRFIDIGIAVGEELFEVIKTEFLPPA